MCEMRNACSDGIAPVLCHSARSLAGNGSVRAGHKLLGDQPHTDRALLCGPLRGIPFGWRLIDCSFGVLGAVPLLYCLRLTRRLAASPPEQR